MKVLAVNSTGLIDFCLDKKLLDGLIFFDEQKQYEKQHVAKIGFKYFHDIEV